MDLEKFNRVLWNCGYKLDGHWLRRFQINQSVIVLHARLVLRNNVWGKCLLGAWMLFQNGAIRYMVEVLIYHQWRHMNTSQRRMRQIHAGFTPDARVSSVNPPQMLRASAARSLVPVATRDVTFGHLCVGLAASCPTPRPVLSHFKSLLFRVWAVLFATGTRTQDDS
jgi:hypothetical protein